MIHEPKYYFNLNNGLWKAHCEACGWVTFGTREEVQARFACHGIEWQPVSAEQTETVGISSDNYLKKKDFLSCPEISDNCRAVRT